MPPVAFEGQSRIMNPDQAEAFLTRQRKIRDAREKMRDLAVTICEDQVLGIPTPVMLDKFRRLKLDYINAQAEGLPF